MSRIIALYLPQFHAIPENDKWWGKGFTEWTNVRRAKPSFKGHEQPKVPGELGYYNLLDADIKQKQADLARQAGIEGFCYYHYWFGLDKNGKGKQLLEKPLQQVIESGKPDYPFCLCWANHTWSNKTWEKSSAMVKEQILMAQEYQGVKDYTEHFYSLLPTFKDARYMKVDGKLLFFIYDCIGFKDVTMFMQTWHDLAKKEGIADFYFVAMMPSTLTYDPQTGKTCVPNLKSSQALIDFALSLGFDAVNTFGKRRGELLYVGKWRSLINKVLMHLHLMNSENYDYEKTVTGFFAPEDKQENVFPTVLPQWDRTARVGKADGVYLNATPKKWGQHLRQALQLVAHKQPEHQIVVIKSWNEWAEGNYLEPDEKYGRAWLEVIRKSILFYFFLFFMPTTLSAVNTLKDSVLQLGLPTVIVETKDHEEPTADNADTPEGCWGGTITNATKIEGSVLVLSPVGDTVYNSGEYVKKTSGMTIKLRGNWSARSTKKAYKIKLQADGDMLARGDNETFQDKEWALIRESYGDKPLVTLKILIGMKLSGWVLDVWSPAFQYVNLIMNGEYRGLYVLTELVTRNKSCRVNVNKSNGYLVELDPYWWNEDKSVETPIFQDVPVKYTFKHPDSDDVTDEQMQQLGDYLTKMEQSIIDGTYNHYIDVENWARWLIAQDILGTYDYAGSNQYFMINDITKDSLVQRGPLWDFDTNFQISDQWSNIHISEGLWYYHRLLNNPNNDLFKNAYADTYQSIAESVFDSVYVLLDNIAGSDWKVAMDSSIKADRQRWPNEVCAMDSSIKFIRNYFQQRQQWLDSTIQEWTKPDPTQLEVLHRNDISIPRMYWEGNQVIIRSESSKYNVLGIKQY